MYSDQDDFARPKARSRNLGVTILMGLLLIYYSFCIAVNLTALSNRANLLQMSADYHFPIWVVPAVTFCFLLNVVWAVLLLQWKKWAFYALFITSVLLFAISVGSMEPFAVAWQSGQLLTGAGLDLLLDTPLLCLLALFALFVLLHWGGPRSTWSQME